MKFEELVSEKLWAVREDNADAHELEILLDHWNDVVWLRDFFVRNQGDLKSSYNVSIEDAIWLTTGAYIITGGAIKLTQKMEEREHTKNELAKIENVRNFLLNEHIIDDDSFIEYIAEI